MRIIGGKFKGKKIVEKVIICLKKIINEMYN